MQHQDLAAIAVLCLLPILLWVPVAVLGHPVIPGDDLTQNYPLRVLSGQLIRAGHLPAWDPYIWSGTPLLAGWNAGAMYPGTWLFSVLPGTVAWTVNLVVFGIVSGTGTYVLLRCLRRGPLASTLGGLLFTYTGFEAGQIVHIGLVEGTSYTPWILVAIELLARTPRPFGATKPMMILVGAAALSILAGEPRAISSAILITAIYLSAVVWRNRWRQGLTVMLCTLVTFGFAAGISAIQWLPGLSFVSGSQRSLAGYQGFADGSLTWLSVARALLVPFLLGGNGTFGFFRYIGPFNLPEVTIGLGLLALVAVFAYLPEVARRLAAPLLTLRKGRQSDRTHDASSPIVVWYVMGFVGLLLTLGTTIPLGNVLARLPLYGGERLQNRNAVMIDLALAILVAYFIDDVRTTVGMNRLSVARDADHRVLCSRKQRLLALVPVAAVASFIIAELIDAPALERHLGVVHPLPNLASQAAPYLAATGILAIATAIFIVARPRLTPARATAFVTLLALGDLGTFLVNGNYASPSAGEIAPQTTESATLARLVGQGRFAIYNPLTTAVPGYPAAFTRTGKPDLNILRGLLSVQGYSSIVSGAYQIATSTHQPEALDRDALRNGRFSSLNLKVLLTLPEYVDHPLVGSGTSSTQVPWTIPAGSSLRWFLDAPRLLSSVTAVVQTNAGTSNASIEIGLKGKTGSTAFESLAIVHGQSTLDAQGRPETEEVVIRNPTSAAITVTKVTVRSQSLREAIALDGALQGYIGDGQWSYGGMVGPFVAFVDEKAPGPVWLQSLSTRQPERGEPSLGTVTDRTSPGGTDQTTVHALRPCLVVRSEAYQPGWTVSLRPVKGGTAQTLRVLHFGLVQAVQVPAGTYNLNWRYAPRGLTVARDISVLFSLGVALIMLSALLHLRRNRWLRTTR